MTAFFASGNAADIVLAVLLAETIWLIARGHPPIAVLLALSPGAMMVIALRAALVGAPWPLIALPLTVSLPLHLADLRHRRWLKRTS